MAGFPPYDNAADLNSRFKALGPYLMRMRTCSELLFASSNCTMGMSCAVPSAFRSKRTRSTEFQLLSGHFTVSPCFYFQMRVSWLFYCGTQVTVQAVAKSICVQTTLTRPGNCVRAARV